MNVALLDIIDEIIELLEDERIEAYIYDDKKFQVIDKDNNIDFIAKLSNNNYYFKDNISGMSFMKVKKYINDNTTIQQILIEEDKQKLYYSYLERDGYVNLVREVKFDGENSLVCNNFNVLNHSFSEIEEYADECFDNINGNDDIKEIKITLEGEEAEKFAEKLAKMEDAEIERLFNYISESEHEDIDKNNILGKIEEFEKMEKEGYSIDDYIDADEYVDEEDEYEVEYGDEYDDADENDNENNNDNDNDNQIDDYEQEIEEYYKDFQLTINEKQIEGEPKYKIIADCEGEVDEKAYDSTMFDHAAINLKAVLDSLQKQSDYHKKDDFEK